MQGARRGEVKLRRRGRGRGRGEAAERGPVMRKKEAEAEDEEEMPAVAAGLIRVKRELLAACMTCPLCHKLFRDATTISECLHTFCRKCIHKKLTEEEADCCPICKIDLGCSPIEKLRPDHNLQDMRAKLFPFKRRKIEAPQVSSSLTLPVRRKERSLSSLVVNTPRTATPITSTARRSNANARRREDTADDKPDSPSSAETLAKLSQSRRQSSSVKDVENGGETSGIKSEVWKPLNCLVEAASRTKTLKVNGPAAVGSSGQNINDETKPDIPASPAPVKARRRRRSTARALPESSCTKHATGTSPIWFSLTAAADQEEHARLPQISSSYVRVKDCNLPVLFIQKYLAKKLDLASEAEVEIKCRGQTVSPALAMWELAGLWLQRAPTPVGPSAEDFVMALSYARRPIST